MTVGPPDAPYLPLIESSLSDIVGHVVPPSREGILNARSARLILESWRARRILAPSVVDAALAQLDSTKFAGEEEGGRKRTMARADVLRRIEEDRERHKRLRERMWILPIPALRSASPALVASAMASPAMASPAMASPAMASPAPHPRVHQAPQPEQQQPSPLDVEFDQMWEGTSDLGEDDLEAMKE